MISHMNLTDTQKPCYHGESRIGQHAGCACSSRRGSPQVAENRATATLPEQHYAVLIATCKSADNAIYLRRGSPVAAMHLLAPDTVQESRLVGYTLSSGGSARCVAMDRQHPAAHEPSATLDKVPTPRKGTPGVGGMKVALRQKSTMFACLVCRRRWRRYCIVLKGAR